MSNVIKSLIIIGFMILLQLSTYNFFLKPIITTWGASENEVSMPMAGDDKTPTITSTRGILIDAPKSDVWKWLMQLGADRNGFYSYTFIERAMGYKTRQQNLIKLEFKDLKVGEVVRGSVDEKSSIIPYNFRVRYVKPDETLVLDNWGTFLLEPVNNHQTRLIIRTQEIKSINPWIRTAQYIVIPLHYIMERRTLMGIKESAEAGENIYLSHISDIVWFSGIVLSALLIYISIFLGRGFIQSIIIPSILSISWLLTLLFFDPIPLYSMGLLLIVCGYIIYMVGIKIRSN